MSSMSEEFGAAMQKIEQKKRLIVVTKNEVGVINRVKPWGKPPAPAQTPVSTAVIDRKDAERESERRPGVEAGEAEKQKAIAKVASGRQPLVDAAREIAIRLSKEKGPITIEDVMDEMKKRGFEDLDSGSKDSPKNWKGAVFGGNALFTCVGSERSKNPKAKARSVRRWVLKTWLQDNPLGGSKFQTASFNLWKIYQDWKACHKDLRDDQQVFLIGADALAESFKDATAQPEPLAYLRTGEIAGYKLRTLYGIPIIPCDMTVGALIMDREYAKSVLPENIKKFL